ncbi:tRNA (N6-isopentenyl adenosine(37)-C2)-methylthiotransferase MiaB [Candidatus Peregrinibacteria bacterium]|mgnify:FL=1|nr:tRNA (N6-isopentenyl adenosine(37)-C2)-methylthiotransferase MiaB [Candidatus Peregrinibacteria bacterium]
MNTSDSERIASVLERLGYEKAADGKEANMLIFNTCSVKQKAEDRVLGLRRQLADLKKTKQDLQVAITGCMVSKTSTEHDEKHDQLLRRMPELDIAFRIEDVAKLPKLMKKVDPSLEYKDELDEGTLENYFKIIPKKATKFSVFVPIMTGCDKFCTYCIVPFTRGREYSRDFTDIIEECKRHVEEGAVEITLVGQTVNSYGLSFNDKKSGKFEKFGSSPFSTLLREVDKLSENGLKRLRFTSPHPRDFTDELIGSMAALKTICPYFHMPVQSGDDRTLRRMNRNYKTAEYIEIVKKIKSAMPDCAISTDIIVGFCGETDEEYENTYNMYKEMEWDMCFLSRYSPRKGTYSEKKLKDDIPHELKAKRWHHMNKLLLECAEKSHKKYIGQTLKVLVTHINGNKRIGRSRAFKEVQFESDKDLTGQIIDVKITKAGIFHLEGERK